MSGKNPALRLALSATAIRLPSLLVARVEFLIGKRSHQCDDPLHEHLPIFFRKSPGEKPDDFAAIREVAFPLYLRDGFENPVDKLMRGFRNIVSLQFVAPQERTHGFDELEGGFWRWRFHELLQTAGRPSSA